MATVKSQSNVVAKAKISYAPKPNGSASYEFAINPESLKVSYANQIKKVATGNGVQYNGSGTTKMQVQLFIVGEASGIGVLKQTGFLRAAMGEDTAASEAMGDSPASGNGSSGLSTGVGVTGALAGSAAGIGGGTSPGGPGSQSKPSAAEPGHVIPLVTFEWGAFKFEGVIESMEENLEHFSADGIPIRASVSLSLSRNRLQSVVKTPSPAAGLPGTNALTPSLPGLTAQALGAAAGGGSWQGTARAMGIENPRHLTTGVWMDPRKAGG